MEALTKEEEKLMELFQPDTLLPTQYWETLKRKSHLDPDKQLMLAVLDDAITCFQKYQFYAKGSKGWCEFKEAKEWIMDERSGWFFSFNNICEVLGINPQYLRRGLVRWKEKQRAGSRVPIKCGRRYNSGSGRRKIK